MVGTVGSEVRVPAGRVLSSGREARQYVVVLDGHAEVGEGGATVLVLQPGELDVLTAVHPQEAAAGENGAWATLRTWIRRRPRSTAPSGGASS